ncbi:neutral zinc metallopeptidase [Kocuria sp. M1R5S2]|uniref:KPN_02809 family neutral zinc metallopeptidase n=1 Tax=Kocuria rhizosphaerae TaxID=3376285 RepID=UPI0037B9EB05
MTFSNDSQLDPGRVGGGRGRRGAAIGGGVGGTLLLLVVALIFGPDAVDTLTGGDPGPGAGTTAEQEREQRCRSGEDANRYTDCRMIATAQSLDQFWDEYLPRTTGEAYVLPDVFLFEERTNTGCGAASSAVGPFYCPADRSVYLDVGFFDELQRQFGAEGGPLAEEYVLAHEFGHHIQHQLGTLGYAQQDPQGPESGAVRVELQADCFAGLWANGASGDTSGAVQLDEITPAQLAQALDAAEVIGDDRIQETMQGRVSPEAFTHGTSAQRQAWFTAGYETGDIARCDTFDAPDLDDPASLAR